MDKLNRMAVFAVVVAEGSFSAAGRRLGMSPSAVSQHMRTLEQDLRVTLLHRSTRKLTLTDAGAAFYPGCKAMLHEASQAEQRLAEMRDTLVGELRIATTIGLGGAPLAQALAPLLQAHPKLSLRILANDEIINLIEVRADIALRVNRQLDDASYIAHPLAVWPMVLCASPRYLNRCGIPETPDELSQHQWLVNTNEAVPASIELHRNNGETRKISLPDIATGSSSMNVLRAFTLEGIGVSIQPLYEIEYELKRGDLVLLLPEWRPAPLKLHALTLERVHTEKSRQAMQCLRDYFQNYQQR
ncbi:LysR family transcriptional regulator [Hafnia paralvei ATCC 29927]|jgi:LysR family transcriptional regulator, transcriptional activator for aaeXAB operon|uniref:LysR family transcriptional regulator n=1 Tax=Hafnia TaxID=568 RepID=UPI0007E3290F|nr:LysR substrate-binding domain-containing protein [Hafnia paralvei]MDU1192658.1 LysR substrate-binding domain-containing protein [Enterobacteriaceae bacterium]MBU2671161.1 LysR family transcriptional regulator [Hafnia paralvei]MCE9880934.1 LysR substrate-binding domain-containing protein [Hafnia paralvei]MCE9908772.1 LysR substrate-binding domain-containing protein [Hafnia paralvei]MCE9910050.1 LysR substrate-binding domain-containing protein [Hafnia paralvei]